jgi:hypothetical protein
VSSSASDASAHRFTFSPTFGWFACTLSRTTGAVLPACTSTSVVVTETFPPSSTKRARSVRLPGAANRVRAVWSAPVTS